MATQLHFSILLTYSINIMIPRYCIIIKDVLSGKEIIHPVIYYEEFDAKMAISEIGYSKVYNDIFIKLII